jgi:hypothetical protein
MAHLFNKTEYYDYRSKVYSNFKKTLEGKIDYLMTENSALQLHPIDIQEDIAIDGINLNFTYDG